MHSKHSRNRTECRIVFFLPRNTPCSLPPCLVFRTQSDRWCSLIEARSVRCRRGVPHPTLIGNLVAYRSMMKQVMRDSTCSVKVTENQDYHDDNSIVTDGTTHFRHEYNQWWQSWHHDGFQCFLAFINSSPLVTPICVSELGQHWFK